MLTRVPSNAHMPIRLATNATMGLITCIVARKWCRTSSSGFADAQITAFVQVKRCDEMARKIRYFHEQVS